MLIDIDTNMFMESDTKINNNADSIDVDDTSATTTAMFPSPTTPPLLIERTVPCDYPRAPMKINRRIILDDNNSTKSETVYVDKNTIIKKKKEKQD